MNDDTSGGDGSESRSWLEKLGQAIGGGDPKNRQDLLDVLRDSLEREILDPDTFGMLEGAIGVAELQVRDAMIPRGQMVCLSVEDDLQSMLSAIVESGHSRFPVIKSDKDEVVGILLAKDLLRYFVASPDGDFKLTDVLRKPAFIPESKRLNVLLKEFRASRNHMAIVVDEYGGVTGLITIEDVLEEIVGEIDDEHDDEDVVLIRKKDDGSFLVDALTPIHDFNDYFGTEFSEENFDTIGGLLTGELGRLAESGEQVRLGSFVFEVVKTDSRRVLVLGLRREDLS